MGRATALSTLHLISGLPCSGKTTYAKTLSAQQSAIHFCLDYWLISLFGRYSIEEIGKPEHTRRVLACRVLMWDMADELLRKGSSVVLDDGFFLREHRVQCIARAKVAGAAAVIHFLDVPTEELRRRLLARNSELPEFNFFINPNLLESFGHLFEKPGQDEGASLIVQSPTLLSF